MDKVPSIIDLDIAPRPSLGEVGELAAARFLEQNGYRIVVTNFKVPVGRNSKGVAVTGEIDIIALDDDMLCFVEVKTRRSDEFASLTANVDLRKQRQITRTAKLYRRLFNVLEMPYRFDVVTVLMPKHGSEEVVLLTDYWNESKFRKSRWRDELWMGI